MLCPPLAKTFLVVLALCFTFESPFSFATLSLQQEKKIAYIVNFTNEEIRKRQFSSPILFSNNPDTLAALKWDGNFTSYLEALREITDDSHSSFVKYPPSSHTPLDSLDVGSYFTDQLIWLHVPKAGTR